MKAVLRLTGMTADTLRAWERRYGAVKPVRTQSGRRVYNQQEVNRLKILHELVQNGHSIGSIAFQTDKELTALSAMSRSALRSNFLGGEKLKKEVLILIEAVEKFDLNALRKQLAKIRYEMSSRDFIFYLVPQLMTEVGQQIDRNELSIAQEHAISDLIRQHLRQVYESLESLEGSAQVKRNVVFAAPEGHLHDFGLIMAATLCRYQGIKTHYIGPNLPAHSLSEAGIKIRPSAIVLSISLLPPDEEKINVQSYIEELDQNLPKSCELWIGGSGAFIVKREKLKRDVWIFESLKALEDKLS